MAVAVALLPSVWDICGAVEWYYVGWRCVYVWPDLPSTLGIHLRIYPPLPSPLPSPPPLLPPPLVSPQLRAALFQSPRGTFRIHLYNDNNACSVKRLKTLIKNLAITRLFSFVNTLHNCIYIHITINRTCTHTSSQVYVFQHIEANKKWAPLCRQHFGAHFLWWKWFILIQILLKQGFQLTISQQWFR